MCQVFEERGDFIMKLTGQQAREIVCEYDENWEEIESNPVDTSRWSIHYEGIFKHIPTEKYYKFKWRVGATEDQDERPFEYAKEVIPVEVHKVEKVVQVWETINVSTTTS